MNRYAELCKAYKQYSDDRYAYLERSRKFIAKLVDEFAASLDAPENKNKAVELC